MTQTNSELLNLHTTTESKNTHKQQSNSELIHTEDVGSFKIVGNEERGYFVSLGKYRLTEARTTIEECKKLIETKDWELLLALMGVYYEFYGDEQVNRIQNLVHNILDDRLAQDK